MNARQLAALHARAFTHTAPWPETALTALLADPLVTLCTQPGGFALLRTVMDEAEVLTIAVDPSCQRQGLGRELMIHAMAEAKQRGAARLFLEVSAENAPARALYDALGFTQTGQRKGYYRSAQGTRIDALILTVGLAIPPLYPSAPAKSG